MKFNFKHNFILFFLFFSCILFYILFGILAYHNRFSEDDFAFYVAVKKLGIVEASIQNYFSWNSRWASLLLINTVFYFTGIHSSLLAYHLTAVFFLIFSLFFLIRNGLIYFFEAKVSSFIIYLFSTLFCLAFFYTTFNKGETWFWVTASGIYLWSISFACMALGLILRNSKTILDFLIVSVSGLFIGGSSEVFAFTLSIILLYILICLIIKQRQRSDLFLKLSIFFFLIVISLLIAYSGQGTQSRRSALPHPGLYEFSWIYIKSLGKLCLLYLPQKIGIALIFGLPFLHLGSLLHKKNEPATDLNTSFFKKIFLLFLPLIGISLFPVVYILGEAGPERAWTQISFYLTLLSCTVFSYSGMQLKNTGKINFIILTGSIIIISVLCFDVAKQSITVSKYAKAFDARMNTLDSLRKNNRIILFEVESLPPCGYLHSAEISPDETYFSNQQMKSALELPFDIRLKGN